VRLRDSNPSDLGLLTGAADLSTSRYRQQGFSCLTAKVPEAGMKAMAGRSMNPCRSAMKAPAS